MFTKEQKLGTFNDHLGLEYSLFKVSAIELSQYIKDTYSKNHDISDFSEFSFEIDTRTEYGEAVKKYIPSLPEKQVMLEQGFICLSGDILLDGFNRLLNGPVPDCEAFIKVYTKLTPEQELKLYHDLNLFKNYSRGGSKNEILSSSFLDRGLLLYLTLRSGIRWNQTTHEMVSLYFSNYNLDYFSDSKNNRGKIIDKMLLENTFLFEDLKFIEFLSKNENTFLNRELSSLLGMFRSKELFGIELAYFHTTESKKLNDVKIEDIFDRNICEQFWADEIVKINFEKSKTSGKKDEIYKEMWKHFLLQYFLPRYAGTEVVISDIAAKASAKKKKVEFMKSRKVIKRDGEANENFEAGKEYDLVYENRDRTEFGTMKVIYSGIKTLPSKTQYGITSNSTYHVFENIDELKKLANKINSNQFKTNAWQHECAFNINHMKQGVFSIRKGLFRLHSATDKIYLVESK